MVQSGPFLIFSWMTFTQQPKTTFLGLCIAVFFGVGCLGEPIETKHDLYERIYSERSHTLDSFESRLVKLPGIQALGSSPEAIDTPIEQSLFKLLLSHEAPIEYDSVKHPLNMWNTVVVHDKYNRFNRANQLKAMFLKRDSTKSWILATLKPSSPVIGLGWMDMLWSRKKKGTWMSDYTNEPIYKRDSAYHASKLHTEFDHWDSIKYVMVLDDDAYLAPELVSDEEFESGVLLTKTELYDLKNQQLLARQYLFTTNDSVLSYKEYPNARALNNQTTQAKMLNNLMKARNDRFMETYAIKPNATQNYFD